MLRLYTLWELERELSPDEFQHILTPDEALKKATFTYDLDYRNYTSPPVHDAPRRLACSKEKPYIRSEYDPVYDSLKLNLMEGWLIGLDTDEYWDDTVNPFHINADGELVFDGTDPFCWVVSDFQRAYRLAINNQNGKKAAPTDKFRPSDEPVQHSQTTKTISSKAAGRLLAAGGIYNGNTEDFYATAQRLGGDAPAGYEQVMDNKGLLIAGASIAAGLTMGRMRFPDLEALEQYGARGTVSGRPFDPEKAGGPIENLTTDGVIITHEGIEIVEKHTSRFGDDPANAFMVNRLKKIVDGEITREQVDLNYYTHECREYKRYCNLGWETGTPADNIEAHELWNNTHTATLEDYKLKGAVEDLYHPDAPLW